MDASEFMQFHADNAVAGKMGEVMKDLTPDALAQVGALLAGGPNPIRSNNVVSVGEQGGDHTFDVTYSGDDGKSVTVRDTVRQVDGTWKIVNLAKP